MGRDAAQFRDFYETPLGGVARTHIGRGIREAWPDTRGQAVVGIGYAVPYLGTFADEAERALAIMPARQGVVRWPGPGAPNRAALCEEDDLPLPDDSMDRALLVHALEHSEMPRHLLRDVWRVVRPSGRVLVVVPNRRGLWARLEHTPFGHGHPYAPSQLAGVLRDNLFAPVRTRDCLYSPPLRARWLARAAPALERLGGRGLRVGGGADRRSDQADLWRDAGPGRAPAPPPRARPEPSDLNGMITFRATDTPGRRRRGSREDPAGNHHPMADPFANRISVPMLSRAAARTARLGRVAGVSGALTAEKDQTWK